jgi:predicted secreted acid phosphatase
MIIKAILKINSNAIVTVRGNDINTCEIEWHNGTTPISKADIQAQFPIVEFDMAMEDLRSKRNKLLADTDYTVLQDSTYTDAQVAEWVIYRQELRDLTNGLTTVEQVDDVIWPTKPGA